MGAAFLALLWPQLGDRRAQVTAAFGATLAMVADGTRLVLDARVLGLGAGLVALLLRAPFLVVVGVAALAAALVRLA